jgi:hypothetical protein
MSRPTFLGGGALTIPVICHRISVRRPFFFSIIANLYLCPRQFFVSSSVLFEFHLEKLSPYLHL